MSDVNEAMQAALASYSGARADKDAIKSGAGFGAGIRIWPSERVFVSLEFQRLLASNSGSGQFGASTYHAELEVPASSLAMSVGCMLTRGSTLRAGLAAGGGYYLTTGEITITGPGVNDRSDLEGSGAEARRLKESRHVAQHEEVRPAPLERHGTVPIALCPAHGIHPEHRG
jgi:hypothetical protein